MPIVISGTNGISGVDGTASNPSYEGTDANTGVFFPAADTVAIGTGGTEALRVNSSQNVGIGTTTPKLNTNDGTFLSVINATANGWLELGTGSTTDGFGGAVTFNNTNIAGSDKRTAQISSVRTGANNSAAITFFTNNAGTFAERMRIDSSGNVVVNGTAANVYGANKAITLNTATGQNCVYEYTVNGVSTGYFGGSSTATWVGSKTSIPVILYTGDTERARIDSSGNLLQTGVTTASGVLMSGLGSGSSNSTINNAIYNITINGSAKVFWVFTANGDGCLVVTNYTTSTITILGTGGVIVASASPASNQLGISKSANSHAVTFRIGSAAATTWSSWGVGSLSSSVA